MQETLPGLLTVTCLNESFIYKVTGLGRNKFEVKNFRTVPSKNGYNLDCKWSPDNKFLGISSENNLWVINSAGKVIFYLGDSADEEYGYIDGFDFTRNSKAICYSVNDRNIRVKSLSGELFVQMTGYSATLSVRDIKCSPFLDHMALAGVDGHIRIHNVWEGALLETLGAYQETKSVYQMEYHPTQRTDLLACDRSGAFSFWDLKEKKVFSHLPGNGKIHDFSFAYSDPNLVVCVDEDSFLRLWDTRTSKMNYHTLLTSNRLNCVDLHPGGNVISVGTAGGEVIVFDKRNTKLPTDIIHRGAKEVVGVHFQRPSKVVGVGK